MIGDSGTNDDDLEVTSLSIFDHESVQDTELIRPRPLARQRRKRLEGTNFKSAEALALVMPWKDISLDAITGKDQSAAKY